MNPPVVLIIAGNDPTGGAGIAADIQAITALGAHPAPVLSALTVQDTVDARAVQLVDPGFVVAQAEAVLADLRVAAIKLGLLGEAAVGRAVADLLARHPGVPVVCDPVLVAAGGAALAEDALVEVYLERLAPRAALLTPNALESRRLAPQAGDADARARTLIARGARAVLIKGGDEPTPTVINALHSADGTVERWEWPRLPGGFHGSGCTLASAIAARLALGDALAPAVAAAQRATQAWLEAGWALGRGQRIPARR